MSQQKEIRILQFQDPNLDSKTAQHFANLFNTLSTKPAEAKLWRGRFSLDFPDFDADHRPAYAIPEIRNFIKVLDVGCPRMVYFLVPNPAAEHILFYLLCLIPVRPQDGRYQYVLQELLAIAQKKLENVAQFCESIKDDFSVVQEGILLNLPPEYIRDYKDLSERALVAMQPTLQAIARNYEEDMQTPSGRHIIRTVVGRAAILLHFDFEDALDTRLLKKVMLKLKIT